MLQTLTGWLGADQYLQHAICLTNDPIIMGLYLLGDLTIFVSYFLIGGSLILQYAVRNRFEIHLPVYMKALYGSFIFLCGLTHLTKTITLFSGIYRLDILVISATAAVSATTAYFTAKQVLSND